jgi:hypothetical protein
MSDNYEDAAARRELVDKVNKEAIDLAQDILSIAQYREMTIPSIVVTCAAVIRSIAEWESKRTGGETGEGNVLRLFNEVYTTQIGERDEQ